MIARLAELDDRLESGCDRLLRDLGAMDEGQRSFRPRTGVWSPTEVAHHLLLVHTGIVATLRKVGGEAMRRRSVWQRLGHRAVLLVLRSGIRVRNPVPSVTPDPGVTFEQLEPEWAAARADTRALFESLDEPALERRGFRHPIAGPLTVFESLEFLASHLEHHHRQLDRIRAHSDYPA